MRNASTTDRNATFSTTLLRPAAAVVLALSWLSMPASAFAAPTTFKLGAVAPLSGDFAIYGQQIQQALALAKEDLGRELPTIAVDLVYEDACLPAQTVAAARKFVNIDHIHALVASYCVIGMIPMAPILGAAQIPAFHTSAVSDELLQSGEYIFTTNVAVRDEATAAANFATTAYRATRAGIFFIASQWGQDYATYFTKEFERSGGTVAASVETSRWLGDYRSDLLRFRSGEFDVIFVAHVGQEFSSIVRQMRQLGIKARIIGPHEATEAAPDARHVLEGTVLISPTHPDDDPLKFGERYRSLYGVPPSVLARNAYDALRITTRALADCHGDRVCTRSRISSTTDYAGQSGTFSIRPGHGASKRFQSLQWHAGAYSPVDLGWRN